MSVQYQAVVLELVNCVDKLYQKVVAEINQKDDEIKLLKDDLNEANQILWDICDKWKDTVNYEQAAYEVRQVLERHHNYLKRFGI